MKNIIGVNPCVKQTEPIPSIPLYIQSPLYIGAKSKATIIKVKNIYTSIQTMIVFFLRKVVSLSHLDSVPIPNNNKYKPTNILESFVKYRRTQTLFDQFTPSSYGSNVAFMIEKVTIIE